MNEPSDDYIISLFSESDTRSEGFKLLLKKYKEKVYWHVRTIVVLMMMLMMWCGNVFMNLGKY